MQILIATHNPAKLKRYQGLLGVLGEVQLLSLADLQINDKIDETGQTNLENAILKARFYGDLSGKITLSVDDALMTNFLPDNEQPGTHARRLGGDRELNDDEILEYWSQKFNQYPQADKQFIWSFALALYNPADKTIQTDIVNKISYVVSRDKHSTIIPKGYPVSAIVSPTPNGKTYADLADDEALAEDRKAFDDFIGKFNLWLKKID
jgi:inosine/xanthosine triphosphate pyrophosphatase family protein